ncbi:hypothetical protein R3P38DRAFT_2958778 [Favolaschia claudopus]|uniref:Secreted protein n=1 Tax=Favolaschia claudopus TaxID=2862362 RepID=A0AAW0BC41_9AGAR
MRGRFHSSTACFSIFPIVSAFVHPPITFSVFHHAKRNLPSSPRRCLGSSLLCLRAGRFMISITSELSAGRASSVLSSLTEQKRW